MATPIGNLADLSLRAIAVLRGVDLIAAEDTRTTATLLAVHGVRTPMIAAHAHNQHQAAARMSEALAQGKSVALVSDAGTPGISDPGGALVRAAHEGGHQVVPVPGACAAIAALSVSGFEGAFHFAGFLPPKSAARREALSVLARVPAHLVLYEAPHRIAALAEDLARCVALARRVLIAREITKRFETIALLSVGELPAWVAGDTNRARGELVVVVERDAAPMVDLAEGERVLSLLLEELPAAKAARLAAAISGAPRDALYRRALELRDPDQSERD
ncbi:MAG: 16S rRNA (cytidine(1402)-2'-O)-methyltransferase [Burkholderiales bacterium]